MKRRPSAVATAPAMAVTAIARVDRRTKDLTKRMQPGEIAVINHADIDRVAAEGLIAARVGAVVSGCGVLRHAALLTSLAWRMQAKHFAMIMNRRRRRKESLINQEATALGEISRNGATAVRVERATGPLRRATRPAH